MPSGTLKAIETRYAGHRFRSRLEARWAVAFNALGIRWEYEKEGFDLPKSGRYLPDFWLPDLSCWVEVKGATPTDDEVRKASELRDEGEWPVVLVAGAVSAGPHRCFALDIGHSSGGPSEWDIHWYICDVCKKPKLSWGDGCHDIVGSGWAAHPSRWCGPRGWVQDPETECGPTWNLHDTSFDTPISKAVEAANSARFEFGGKRRRR